MTWWGRFCGDLENTTVYRFIIVIALTVFALPGTAQAEYAWVTRVKKATSAAAIKVGQCWDSCSDACGQTTRRWLRKSVDYFAPDAKAEAAARCGLRLPAELAADSRLVILIHGLDSTPDYWQDLMPLLIAEGYAVAPLAYPNDQPLNDSSELLAREVARLRNQQPKLRMDIVTHSMGGIIARGYLEGGGYRGGIERLVMLAPPNHGSCYSRFSMLSEVVEHCRLWQTDDKWSWTWMVTDGLGEARNDIAPGSRYLADLNARPRRADVRYTILAGNRSCGWRYAANVVRWSSACVPDCRWGKPLENNLHNWAENIESYVGSGDGLVPLANASLPGVDDLIIVPADHTTIACSRNGRPPVAWPIIKDRLRER